MNTLDFKTQLCDGFLVVLESGDSGAFSGLLLQMLRSILTSRLQCHAILIIKSISAFFNHQICMCFFFSAQTSSKQGMV